MTTASTRHPEIPAARYAERLARLRAIVDARGLDALLVGVGPDLDYVIGYRAMRLKQGISTRQTRWCWMEPEIFMWPISPAYEKLHPQERFPL